MSDKVLFPFDSWADVLDHVESRGALLYKAALDWRAVPVTVLRVYKNGKVRLLGPGGVSFTADSGHLDRCWRRQR